MSSAAPDPMKQLEEKIKSYVEDNLTYDALQYIQSFVSRKCKAIGCIMTSELVFLGARLLINSGASGEAGTLLVWFIEDGAALDYGFRLNERAGECDTVLLQTLLDSFSVEQAAPLVDKIYNPLHLVCAKKHIVKTSALDARLNQLEESFARVFEGTKRWNSAYKVVARLNQPDRLVTVLDAWAAEGYKSEKPLFFARAVLNLLSDKKIELATSLISTSNSYILDNIPADAGSPRGSPRGSVTAAAVEQFEKPESCMDSSLAAWHLATILTNLASLPPMQRVDKQKLFTLLMQLYMPIIQYCDSTLKTTLEKIGSTCFDYVSPSSSRESAGKNPMDLMKAMFAASSSEPAPKSLANAGPMANIDSKKLMSTLKQLESSSSSSSRTAGGGGGGAAKPAGKKK